jgi:eukaryotic-like serine/threonine-protein kinase
MSTCPECGATYPPQVSICAADGMMLVPQEPSRDSIVGTVIAGKYRIDAVIGRGGMGAVYRATHVMLNKTIAVKTIKPDLIESTEMVQRFQREARAATSLEHPNIVAVYDFGQAEDGALYIVMEFVNGVSLKDAIRASGPMPAARIARLLTQVASALARAHRNHVVHRDLKPQNLMIATDAKGEERIKLLDFGIAKSMEEGTTTPLTAAGYSLGTPHYMAPEQAVGQEVDGRADLYALGVILYEMLVGDVPFNAGSAPAVLIMHLNDAPEPPSRRRPDLPISPALEAIALRCLEKNPAQRFQTAEEFSEALERAVPAGTPVAPRAGTDAATALVAPSPLPGDTARPFFLPLEASSVAVPPPLPTQQPGTRPTINARDAAVLPAATPPSIGGGKGRLIVVLLAVAALFVMAVALGGYAAYRAWTSRSDAIAVETVSSDPAPASVPAMAPDTTPPPTTSSGAQSATEGHDATVGTPSQSPPRPAASAPRERSPTSNVAAGVSAAEKSGRSDPAVRGGPGRSAAPPASQSGEVGTLVAGTPPATPAPSPALPKHPPIYFECTGASDVCGALTTAFEQALEREGLPHAARPDGAEILVNASATLVDTHYDQQYGTSFVVQTFSLELRAEAIRDGSAVSMPAAKTFSFDRRVGGERAAEQGRLMAGEALARIQKFWTKRVGG